MHDLRVDSSERGSFERRDGELLFHLALREASIEGSHGWEHAVAAIASGSSIGAAEAAITEAGHHLAAHPDDEVLRRAVLLLDELKRRLIKS